VFDIEVSAQKANAYSKMSQNELALQLYQMGFFNPQMSDQALSTLDMMEFKGRETVMQKVSMNGTLMQKLQQTQLQLLQALQLLDQANGTDMAAQYVAGETGQMAAPAATGGEENAKAATRTSSLGGNEKSEHAYVEQARQKSRTATQPRE